MRHITRTYEQPKCANDDCENGADVMVSGTPVCAAHLWVRCPNCGFYAMPETDAADGKTCKMCAKQSNWQDRLPHF